MKDREWYEKRLEEYFRSQEDIIRLLLDIRDLLQKCQESLQELEVK